MKTLPHQVGAGGRFQGSSRRRSGFMRLHDTTSSDQRAIFAPHGSDFLRDRASFSLLGSVPTRAPAVGRASRRGASRPRGPQQSVPATHRARIERPPRVPRTAFVRPRSWCRCDPSATAVRRRVPVTFRKHRVSRAGSVRGGRAAKPLRCRLRGGRRERYPGRDVIVTHRKQNLRE
jgi:hypothetical protein